MTTLVTPSNGYTALLAAILRRDDDNGDGVSTAAQVEMVHPDDLNTYDPCGRIHGRCRPAANFRWYHRSPRTRESRMEAGARLAGALRLATVNMDAVSDAVADTCATHAAVRSPDRDRPDPISPHSRAVAAILNRLETIAAIRAEAASCGVEL